MWCVVGWCEKQSVASIEAVLALDTPINVGLIGDGLDNSALLTDYLASIANNPLIEMVSHSYYHDSFRDKDYEYQETDLELLQDMSNKVSMMLRLERIPCGILYFNNLPIIIFDF